MREAGVEATVKCITALRRAKRRLAANWRWSTYDAVPPAGGRHKIVSEQTEAAFAASA
ncbi:hypothetical protein KCP70_18620 [Salmonella enterica subsp. enterica]|nr:hypothetical protein KCP70_18620 [Salmonella enterica subsp. enterica]